MFSRKKAGTERFWDWLGENTARVQTGLKRCVGDVAEEVGKEFDKAYPGLVWEVTVPGRGEPWVFCVSGNGNRKLFPRVERAVKEAPKVKGWKIQAFRPRGPLDSEISMHGQTLDADDVWCEVSPGKARVSVVLHLRGVTLQSEAVLSQMALILMDNAIGEYDSVMKIADVEIALLEGTPKVSGSFFRLRNLPAFLDRFGDA